jgi:hypothetical protein
MLCACKYKRPEEVVPLITNRKNHTHTHIHTHTAGWCCIQKLKRNEWYVPADIKKQHNTHTHLASDRFLHSDHLTR